MSLINTLKQISRSDAVPTWQGLCKHLCWQFRRAFGLFPVQLAISRSRIFVEGPSGVAALTNSMGMYDSNNMHLIRLMLDHSPEITFFDIGANVGTYTLIASESPNAQVYAFEPHPVTFSQLARNVEINNRDQVNLLQIVLSDKEGTAALISAADPSLAHIAATGSGATGDSLKVTTRTLDSVCTERKAWPQVLKLDVEGHQLEVLRGFQKGIAKAEILLIEDGEEEDTRTWMAQQQFSGPYWCHFRNREFSAQVQRRAEDPAYLSNNAQQRLKRLGFHFTAKAESHHDSSHQEWKHE
ncbi:MAG: FkbM family methyltransferase [Kiritimatiellae bacterium]|nr:FkbM family methyltransferase [Kiritimatiellia bacterium]